MNVGSHTELGDDGFPEQWSEDDVPDAVADVVTGPDGVHVWKAGSESFVPGALVRLANVMRYPALIPVPTIKPIWSPPYMSHKPTAITPTSR
ncbi:hypothetical protein GCM10023196_033130 [Actinoallomurus vinaceus]|uniref:Uncharacterized protein n=1 Tax=Actinoallomurus vinaceus TaxID=1080074 RepID=A0ABP8UA35_9ACTN